MQNTEFLIQALKVFFPEKHILDGSPQVSKVAVKKNIFQTCIFFLLLLD